MKYVRTSERLQRLIVDAESLAAEITENFHLAYEPKISSPINNRRLQVQHTLARFFERATRFLRQRADCKALGGEESI